MTRSGKVCTVFCTLISHGSFLLFLDTGRFKIWWRIPQWRQSLNKLGNKLKRGCKGCIAMLHQSIIGRHCFATENFHSKTNTDVHGVPNALQLFKCCSCFLFRSELICRLLYRISNPAVKWLFGRRVCHFAFGFLVDALVLLASCALSKRRSAGYSSRIGVDYTVGLALYSSSLKW